MIGYLSGRGQKKAAWLFFFLFYSQLVGYSFSSIGNVTDHRNFYQQEKYDSYVSQPKEILKPVIRAAQNSRATLVSQHITDKTFTPSPDKITIGGPGQPEMSSFKSIGADNMVNLFSGDFSYNIPLLDAGGYPVNLFYNAGQAMDQDASWVGLGWNINPGTISRNMRGLPDDFNGSVADGDVVTKTQSIKQDLTVGVNVGANVEIGGSPLSIGVHSGIFWNNRKGVSLEVGSNFSVQASISKKSGTEKTEKDTIGSVGLSAGATLNSQNGLSLNAGFDAHLFRGSNSLLNGLSTAVDYNARQGLNSLQIEAESNLYSKYRSKIDPAGFLPSRLGSTISFARPSYTPGIRMPLTRYNGNLKIKLGGEVVIFHINGYVSGSVSNTYIAPKDQTQVKPAFGYMYYEKANSDDNALLDFNRLNDGVYTLKTPIISIPEYTYDIFTINGEGTGGSFRGYRGNMGFTRDVYTKSREGSLSLSFDAGGGNIFHGGTELGGVLSRTEVGDWQKENILRNAIAFNENDGVYQAFYFKNPGEKAIIDENYYNTVGNDQLVRPKLTNLKLAKPTVGSSFEIFDSAKRYRGDAPLTASTASKNIRDKRTQLITYLTAEDAEKVGLDSKIYSYAENVFKSSVCSDHNYKTPIRRYNPGDQDYYRKAHHLSEIDVLEGDGKRYIYGIPAYSLSQKEVSFSLNAGQGNPQTQLTGYNASQNSVDNNSGRDGAFQSELTPAYAHSFLLTAILSPDYVDVTGNGISDDDIGTAVKFNYTRVNKSGSNSWIQQKWRTPVESFTAHYNEGLKTDNADDKGLYTYGEKELWYTHSIETKNMIVTFTLSQRHDCKSAAGENGGITIADGQRKLERIDLYTKADFLKSNPKPVKTVHFAYSYRLCGNVPNNDGGVEMINNVNVNAKKGKLTLDSLWFSYNGNYKQTKNKYRFDYSQGRNGLNANPDYDPAKNDRWGSFKDPSANPATAAPMTNGEFPYTLQAPADTLKTNVFASAWNLNKIMSPAGAVINVGYEADDYAYVQDRKAAQMTKIAGFGYDAASTPDNKLYTYNSVPALTTHPGKMDNRFVFFDVDDAVTNKAEVYSKYLSGMKQLLLKIWVEMPSNSYGSGYEPVNIYANIKDWGYVASNNHRIWVELYETSKEGSPIMETVLQFLKDMLPSKAFKGYDVGNQSGIRQIVSAVQGMAQGFTQAVEGFENNLKAEGKCKYVNLDNSFARLNNPFCKKLGGGHRVKSIIITDNWKKMIDPDNLSTAQLDSYYGQIYDYTTTEISDGLSKTISSGVATYEPGIGNEENPFREILQYKDKQPLGPTNISNIELPVTEAFFPAPSVGYSKVTVRSIHNKDNKNIKSATGRQETEFYTSRDFPVISDYTDFDSRSRKRFKPNPILKILFQQQKDFLTLSQGFRVILNDMNGKMKSQTSYPENDLLTPINSTTYYYKVKNTGGSTYSLDNNLRIIDGANGVVNTKLVGKEVEIMNDFRDHYSFTRSAQVPLNLETWTIGPIPLALPSLFRAAFKDESLYRSATTLKIINEYGILDSVVNVDKGSRVGTRNMVYDGETGEVLISQTDNEFNKPVYQLKLPAYWANSGMDLAYKNIDVTYKNVRFVKGFIENSNQVDQSVFESGDEIYVIDYSSQGPENTIGCIELGDPAILPLSYQHKIWAVDIAKDERNTEHKFIFIDRYGTPYNAVNATIRIIRSGKRNMVSTTVGNIVTLANPLVIGSDGVERINPQNATGVLSAGAVEYKEKWRVQDGFYSQYTTQVTKRYTPIRNATIPANQSHSTNLYYGYCRKCEERYAHFSDPDFLTARMHITKKKHGHTHSRVTKSYVHFDLGGYNFSNDTRIKSAFLNLESHSENNMNHPFVYPVKGYDFTHYIYDPHLSASIPENSFTLSRMLRPWPGADDGAWESAFDEQSGDYYSQANVLGTTPPISTKNYIGSDAISINGLLQGMISDLVAHGYSPGIKLSLTSDAQHGAFPEVCFAAKKHSHGYSWNPHIDVEYSNCDEAYPAGYTPAAGERVDSCITSTFGRFCFSVFDRKQMNPYVYGLLGNWRPWRSYVYYGSKNETDPSATTKIESDGTIKDFENYWVTGSEFLLRSNSNKWVWNSEVTQFNRKGLEIENHDPLDRYNAGVYGYLESVPVATADNARVREIAFDGFEDYNYQDQVCGPYCNPNKRHFNAGDVSTYLTTTQHHTGKYSLNIPANSSYTITSQILPNDTTVTPDVRVKIDMLTFTDTLFNIAGTGLTGNYWNNTGRNGGPDVVRGPEVPNLMFDANRRWALFHGWDYWCGNHGNLPGGINCWNMSVQWNGTIRADATDDYYFNLGGGMLDDGGEVYIDNQLIYAGHWSNITTTMLSKKLYKNQFYNIRVNFWQTVGGGAIQLRWNRGLTLNNFSPVPAANLYPVNSGAAPVYVTRTCNRPDTINSIHHNLIDSFSLIADRRYVLSAWAKEGTTNCNCASYNNNAIEVKINGNYFTGDLRPSGNIIEGWQRYEIELPPIPSDAQSMTIIFKSLSGSPVFFDDLRINPFNSNMKSFVYNPDNLRLSATLDENNYASFYEYDDEGTLARVKKETKDGVKTITETRSALQKSLPNL